MTGFVKTPDKGDPGEVVQLFPKYNLQLLCCRFWWLRRWEFQELSFPYWRIYYNTKEGARFYYKGDKYEMSPSKIYVIAPNTSYSTQLFSNQVPKAGYVIEGGRICSGENYTKSNDVVGHLFIHFNLGLPYDTISSGIFTFNLTEHLKEKMELIMSHLYVNPVQFDFVTFLVIQSLISDLLSDINRKNWNVSSYDYRILDVMQFVESNLRNDLSNSQLANVANLATNSFNRLFSQEMGMAPQKFVRKRRIDSACIQLNHSNLSIDQIAFNCGFANRYHFTRIFSRVTGLSPSRYRKGFGI